MRCYTHLNESSVAKSTRRSSGSARGLKSPSQVSSGFGDGSGVMANCVGGGCFCCCYCCYGGGCHFVILWWWETRLAWRGEETPPHLQITTLAIQKNFCIHSPANSRPAHHGHADRTSPASTAPQRTLVPPAQGAAHHGPCPLNSAGDVCDGVCDGVHPGRIVGVDKANGEFCVCHAGCKFTIFIYFFFLISITIGNFN